ncbi:hypothetical protein MBLNU457_1710t1 [Dothideomycetes sp. NU457]
MARALTTSNAAKVGRKSTTKSVQKPATKTTQKTTTKKAAKPSKKVIVKPSESSAKKPSTPSTTHFLGNDNQTDDGNIADRAVNETTQTAKIVESQDVVQEDADKVEVTQKVAQEVNLQAAQEVTASTSLFVPPAACTRPTCFLDLPPEIRNQIYAIALKQPLRISIDKMKVPALVQAHEQIRKEAMSMLLNINRFRLAIGVQSKLSGYRLSYCISDGKLRGLGLGSGYITNLQISIKDSGLFRREKTWKIALNSSGEITCSGKALDGRHEYKTANIAQKIEQYISQWLEGKTQRGGLGLEEVWSLLSLFKMELVDAVMR